MNAAPECSGEAVPVMSFATGDLAALRVGIAPRILESRRFGRLEVYPDQILYFRYGLLGFEELQEFCIVAHPPLHPLTFLLACDVPDVAFPVLPARTCLPEYVPVLTAEALEAVGATSPDALDLLAICAVAPDTTTLHANLRGPLLVNPETRRGYQAVLHDSPYSLRHLLGAV